MSDQNETKPDRLDDPEFFRTIALQVLASIEARTEERIEDLHRLKPTEPDETAVFAAYAVEAAALIRSGWSVDALRHHFLTGDLK